MTRFKIFVALVVVTFFTAASISQATELRTYVPKTGAKGITSLALTTLKLPDGRTRLDVRTIKNVLDASFILSPAEVAQLVSDLSPLVDTDGDGVLDLQDVCPTVPAPGTLDGCPVVSSSDTTPPNTIITISPSLPTTSSSVSFSFTGVDDKDVAGFDCKIDAAPFTSCTSPKSYSGLAAGSHIFQVRAVDTSGNIDQTPDLFSWIIDSVSTGACATTTVNVPDGIDPQGGCFPGISNTGPSVAANTLPIYTGSCTISATNTVIDSKVVNCRTIDVQASGFVLKNSYLNGGIVQSGGSPSFTVQDSFVDSAVQYPACSNGSCSAGFYACGDPNNATTDCGITGSNFTILRTEIVHSNRAAYCQAPGPCVIQDSYFHGTNLWPDASNRAHASSVREEQNLTLRHNSLSCSYTGPFVNGDIGCSANLTGYPDFTPIKNNTVDANLFVANTVGNAFCAYGGGTAGKSFSGDSTNATNQRFTNNVFQRGGGQCGAYGAITDFITGRTGNVWSGNVWDDGSVVALE